MWWITNCFVSYSHACFFYITVRAATIFVSRIRFKSSQMVVPHNSLEVPGVILLLIWDWRAPLDNICACCIDSFKRNNFTRYLIFIDSLLTYTVLDNFNTAISIVLLCFTLAQILRLWINRMATLLRVEWIISRRRKTISRTASTQLLRNFQL